MSSVPASTSTSIPIPTNPEQLEAVLSQLVAPDTALLQSATACVSEFLKKPTCVSALMHQISSSRVDQSRQMAAVLLRRAIDKKWMKLTAKLKQDIKQSLLNQLVVEPVRLVRVSVAALVSELAKKLVPKNQWPELLDWLLECSRSSQDSHREVAMMLFRSLADNIPKPLKSHSKTLQQIFTTGMQDSNPKVRLEALHAVGTLIEKIVDVEDEKAMMHLRGVLPPLLSLVQHYVAAADEEVIGIAFEVLEAFAATPTTVLDSHLRPILELMVSVGSNPGFDIGIREKSSLFISQLVAAKPMKLVKEKLIEPLLLFGIRLACEPWDEDASSTNSHILLPASATPAETESSNMTPSRMAVETLDSLYLNVPKKWVYTQSMTAVTGLAKSEAEHDRKAAMIILGTMAEGCCVQMKEQLSNLLSALCQATRDASIVVRRAAWMAVTHFVDYLQPEITKLHKAILPFIFDSLTSSEETDEVKERVCIALDVIFMQLDNAEVLPYLETMMTRLMTLLQSSTKQTIQESIVSAIKSVAAAAEASFIPYFPTTIRVMLTIIEGVNDEQLRLKCRAIEAVGAIAVAVGKEQFAPYIEPMMKLVKDGFDLDFFELRESNFIYIDNLATMLDKDFVKYLETTMIYCLGSCLSDDGIQIHRRKAGELDRDRVENDEDEEDDDPEGEEDLEADALENAQLSIRSGALDEKLAALSCISTCIAAVDKAFLPYVEKVLQACEELGGYLHSYIRMAVSKLELRILFLFQESFLPELDWKRAEPIQNLHKPTQVLLEQLMNEWIERANEESDRETCAELMDCITATLKLFGCTPIKVLNQKIVQKFEKLLLLLLQEKGECQRPTDEADEEDTEDHDEVLIDSVTDVVSALAQAIGPAYDAMFAKQLPHILKFTDPKRPEFDRSMAVGCFAEVLFELGSGVVDKYLPKLIPMVLNGLVDPACAVRRNSAFCAGVLCQVGGKQVLPVYPQLLASIQALYTVPWKAPEGVASSSSASSAATGEGDEIKPTDDDYLGCRDNAASAITKMIVAHPDALPFGPTFTLVLQGLPLQSDFIESKWVYPAIISFFNTHPNEIGPHTPAILSMFCRVFGNPDVDTSVQRDMIAFCRALAQGNNGQAVKQVVDGLPEKQKDAFMKYVINSEAVPEKDKKRKTGSKQ